MSLEFTRGLLHLLDYVFIRAQIFNASHRMLREVFTLGSQRFENNFYCETFSNEIYTDKIGIEVLLLFRST